MDFAQTGLLDGLEEPERRARLLLLNKLEQNGASLEELTAAVREDRLSLLLVEQRLGGRHSAIDLERETGASAEMLLRLRRILGLPGADPDDPVFSADDVEQARSIQLFLDSGFSFESLADITRVLGENMARLAATVTAEFAETFLRQGDSELEVAERFDALAAQLTPALSPVLIATFNDHLLESVHRGMIGRAERESGQLAGAELSVCFADLVGFTRLGGEMEVRELGSVAGRLAALAADLADPPVRLIKTIGDAAMFVSPRPEPLIATALELVEAADAAELPSLRAGIASGPAVQRSGDIFGHSVNLASRVTGVARPGTVLCTDAVRDAARDDFDWSFAGRFRLKGIGETEPLHRPRERNDDDDDDDAAEASSDPARTTRAGRRRRRASR